MKKKELETTEAVNDQPAAEPAKKENAFLTRLKGAFTKEKRNRVVKLLLVVLAILLITNPGLIPFLPASIERTLVGALTSIFGNVSDIVNVLPLNWIVLFKLVIMVLLMKVFSEVGMLLLEVISPKSNRGKTLINIVRSGFKYVVGFVGIFWALTIFGIDIATIFAGVGVLALVIGFGAESLIADLVTGVFMIFENEYNVGDIVELGGYRGTVTSIGIRTTCVTDAGGNVKIFNNGDMRNIINLSNLSSRAVCDFAIPYEVKIADAEAALLKVLEKAQKDNPDVFTEAPTFCGVQELGQHAVTLRVVANVAESNRFKAARLLNRALKDGMEEMGISCPYNQIVVHKADKEQ